MKLALIGSWGHVGTLLGWLEDVPELDLVAAAPAGAGEALGYLGNHPAAGAELPVCDTWQDMLDRHEPDVVGLFAPPALAGSIGEQLARRGIHIVAEKPLAIRADELRAFARAVESAGVQVATMMNLRCAPAFQAARQAVADGVVGRPAVAFGQKSYPFADRSDIYRLRETYGGSIPWAAIHAIDFIAWCTGERFTRVSAMHTNLSHPSHPGMEDGGAILLELSGGGHAAITFDYHRPWPGEPGRPWGDDRLRIAGTDAVVEVTHAGRSCTLLTATGRRDLPLPPERNLLAEFAAAIAGQGRCIVTTAEAFEISSVALAAREAADSGRVITL